MGTITHLYDPAQTVWVITVATASCPSAVKTGTVVQVRGTALITGDTVKYDIRFDGDNGTTEILEANIFSTLNAAVTEYETRLT